MTIKFSQSEDLIAEERVIRRHARLNLLTDWIECTTEQSDLFYFGTTIPEGKQRKPGTLELEDIPTPSNSELFTSEFNTLKAEHESELNKLNLAFASAALVDGDTQAAKQAEIRAAYNLAVAENKTAVNALMVKYYG